METSNDMESGHRPMKINAMQSVLPALSTKLLSIGTECNIHMHGDRVQLGSKVTMEILMTNMTADASDVRMSWDTSLRNE